MHEPQEGGFKKKTAKILVHTVIWSAGSLSMNQENIPLDGILAEFVTSKKFMEHLIKFFFGN
jgi:hypothetical protein